MDKASDYPKEWCQEKHDAQLRRTCYTCGPAANWSSAKIPPEVVSE